MTVSELIDILMFYPPEMVVLVSETSTKGKVILRQLEENDVSHHKDLDMEDVELKSQFNEAIVIGFVPTV